MIPIKMIVTDLDGTLLKSDKTISAYTASIFESCRDMGIKVAFATARPIRAVKMLNLALSFDAAIYHNGAVIAIGSASQILHSIEPKTANVVIRSALEMNPDAQIFVESQDVATTNFDATRLWKDVGFLTSDFLHPLTSSVDKINITMENDTQVTTIKSILPDELYLIPTENSVGMIMHRDATKPSAIMEVSEHFGFSLHNVAAFGDDYNDIEMLRACGVGVAVANAIDEAKVAADYICDANDVDGVAKWLEEHVL